MTRKRHTEEQIIAVLKDAQAGIGIQELCRKHGILDATFYKWRTKYAGLEASDVKKLRQLEDENRRLKQMVAEQALDIQALTAKKLVAPKAKRAAAQWVAERFELSERRVCRLVTLDWNTRRYRGRCQEDAALQPRIREIAETKRRYRCSRIYVRLRREGWPVNHKKVELPIIARNGSRFSGADGRRPRRSHGSRCPSPLSPGAVRPWILCMIGWWLAGGSRVGR